jgi:transcription initiation factor TFIIH subunit 2
MSALVNVSAAAVASAEGGSSQHTWETTGGEGNWDTAVQEDEEGNIISLAALSDADAIRRRRRRLEQNDYAQKQKRVVRDMIRYVYVLIDASRWMRTKDPVLPPGTRLEETIKVLQEFVQEYYDQNPLSHLGFIVLRNGEAEILSQLSSNSKAHKVALQSFAVLAASEPPNRGGEFSLQNGLEVAGRSLGHQPKHGSREVVLLFGALSTCDPGNILTETLPRLNAASVRFSAFALAAELYVCRKLAQETGGVMGVCLDKGHFRDWLLGGQCVPPPITANHRQASGCEMVLMGFPTRTSDPVPTLVHATRDSKLLARTAYLCPQCQAKQSELPTDCAVCGLKLVLAPHLARTFHHLFPVPAFSEVNITTALSSSTRQPGSSIASGSVQVFHIDDGIVTSSKDFDRCCFSCLKLIGTTLSTCDNSVTGRSKRNAEDDGQEVLRFQCPNCHNVFCADCDAFLHETLHNCPGCLCSRSCKTPS